MEFLQSPFYSRCSFTHIPLLGENQGKDSMTLQLEINFVQIYNSVDVHVQLNEKVFHI